MLNLRVAAQGTDATCIQSSWSFNSEKQSPCSIASSLLGVCSGNTYNVAALPNNTVYLGPTIDAVNPCQCNTVVYSLMSACALCQNRTIITWSEWATNCFPVFTGYPKPIPAGLHVPAYAYLDVESQDTFDATAAQQDANATESTALPSSSTTLAATSTSTTSTPTPTASTSDSLKSTNSDSRINTITDSVIGGVLGVRSPCAADCNVHCNSETQTRKKSNEF
ncbi:hypothetical protein BT96DRAFT_376167 [Gymnopus androsaceus JB14]|uniref:Uncharacterized protein n=1 Tax=Gymnopus androsaceus JB14 TaxID=1447944 RepID=A0A6A4IIJ9_9AGAR|nr:hypothetical protein BT96DRAFT_376167 [Gymnopus androsaceus JB14]